MCNEWYKKKKVFTIIFYVGTILDIIINLKTENTKKKKKNR